MYPVVESSYSLQSNSSTFDQSSLIGSRLSIDDADIDQISSNEKYSEKWNHRKLTKIANTAYSLVEWENLLTKYKDCEWKQIHPGVLSYHTNRNRSNCFISKGIIQCSSRELKNVLNETSMDSFKDNMSVIFGKEFIHGIILHQTKIKVQTKNHEYRHSGLFEGRKSLPKNPDYNYLIGEKHDPGSQCDVFLKSMLFAKSGILSRNQQWNYLDFVRDRKDDNGFVKIMSSMHHAGDVINGKNKKKLLQLHSVIAGFTVEEIEPDEDNFKKCRVMFYAEYFKGQQFNSSTRKASAKSIQNRLQCMLNAIPRLNILINRRRLGAQVLIDKALVHARNKRCRNCAQTFGLMQVKIQCQICGSNACKHCSTEQERQIFRKPVHKIHVCNPCMRRVTAANYDYLRLEDLQPAKIFPKNNGDPATAVALAQLLEDALISAEPAKKSSVMAVIRQMTQLIREESKSCASNLTYDRSSLDRSGYTVSSSEEDLDFLNEIRSSSVSDVALGQCVLGNAESRSYHLHYEDVNDYVAVAPLVANEDHRLAVIERNKFRQFGNVVELNIVCELAAKELNCAKGFVTIIDKDVQHIIASNVPDFRQVVMQRNQAVCAHLITQNNPLLVSYLIADVRFHDYELIAGMNCIYYCGFPVVIEGAVIGAVCCVDDRSQKVTELQYNAMLRLVQTTAKIMKSKSQSICKC